MQVMMHGEKFFNDRDLIRSKSGASGLQYVRVPARIVALTCAEVLTIT